jgi:acyl carrier protein
MATTTAHPELLTFIAGKAQVPTSELRAERLLTDFDLDSLTLIEISLFIERQYRIPVPEGDLRLDQRLDEWLSYIDERTS